MDVGDVLAGRYELVDEVGVGGMGRVLRAHDRTLDRPVAVKLLAPHLLGDPGAIAALRDEARRAASVRHGNVVQVLDAVLDDTDQPAIVMEYVDGPSLSAVVPADGLPFAEAMAMVAAVGAGLQAVHEAGLVHRDVTPANVLLDEGVPRLTDFGIARSAAATSTQTVQGSVGYLAPEQASGAAVGPAADVYALGCLATTLLTGSPPFDAETAVGIVHQHLHVDPPDLRSRRPAVPDGVARAVAAALAKDPADRPDSVAAFLATLGAGGAVTSAAAAPTTPVPPVATTQVLDPAPDAGPRRSVLAWLAAGAVVLAALGTIAALGGGDDLPEVAASPTAAAAPPSPSPSPEPEPEPEPSPSPSLSPVEATAVALRDLRALLVDLRSRDALSAEALEKLDERAAEAADKLFDGERNGAAKELRELRRELRDRVEKEEVTSGAEDEILAQVLVVEAALDQVPRGRGGEDEEDDD